MPSALGRPEGDAAAPRLGERAHGVEVQDGGRSHPAVVVRPPLAARQAALRPHRRRGACQAACGVTGGRWGDATGVVRPCALYAHSPGCPGPAHGQRYGGCASAGMYGARGRLGLPQRGDRGGRRTGGRGAVRGMPTPLRAGPDGADPAPAPGRGADATERGPTGSRARYRSVGLQGHRRRPEPSPVAGLPVLGARRVSVVGVGRSAVGPGERTGQDRGGVSQPDHVQDLGRARGLGPLPCHGYSGPAHALPTGQVWSPAGGGRGRRHRR